MKPFLVLVKLFQIRQTSVALRGRGRPGDPPSNAPTAAHHFVARFKKLKSQTLRYASYHIGDGRALSNKNRKTGKTGTGYPFTFLERNDQKAAPTKLAKAGDRGTRRGRRESGAARVFPRTLYRRSTPTLDSAAPA